MRTDTGQIVYLADYRPTDFVLERVDLTFELDPTETKNVGGSRGFVMLQGTF